jgi:hypothetical protein
VRDVAYEMEIVSWRVTTDPKLPQNKTVEALLAREGGRWVYERALTNAVSAGRPGAIGGSYAGGYCPCAAEVIPTSASPYTRALGGVRPIQQIREERMMTTADCRQERTVTTVTPTVPSRSSQRN